MGSIRAVLKLSLQENVGFFDAVKVFPRHAASRYFIPPYAALHHLHMCRDPGDFSRSETGDSTVKFIKNCIQRTDMPVQKLFSAKQKIGIPLAHSMELLRVITIKKTSWQNSKVGFFASFEIFGAKLLGFFSQHF